LLLLVCFIVSGKIGINYNVLSGTVIDDFFSNYFFITLGLSFVCLTITVFLALYLEPSHL
jgi:hypothetical protein